MTSVTGRPATRPLPDPQAHASPAPQRLLIVSGAIGAGHRAAAVAVAEAAGARWPDAEIVHADALEHMRAGVFARIYAVCLRRLRALYALYFWLLGHVGVFRAGTRAVIGAWGARALAPVVAARRPDLVVATFPEGITGLARLRRRGRLGVPVVAVLSDPAPHPMWCDPAVDLTLVTTEVAARRVRRIAPGAAVRVVGPPVVSAFAPSPPPLARARPRVLLSAGSLALGEVPALCRAVLDAGADVVVGCGREPGMRRRLDRLAARHVHGTRLDVRDWIDDVPAAVRDADVVVTTGGGASTFEALAGGRPVIVAAPIPGHGRANARVLAEAGIVRVCPGPAALRAAVAGFVRDAGRATSAVGAESGASTSGAGAGLDALADGLAAALALDPAGPGPRVRAPDALFLHASTPRVPQQVGARIVVEDTGQDDWPEHLRALVAERAEAIELLTRRLAPPRPGRSLRWTRPRPDRARHVRPSTVPGEHDGGDAAATAFFAEPVDPVTIGWELQVARTGPAEVTVLAKVHHALGDGLAVTDALVRLLTDEATRLPAARTSTGPGERAPRRVARAARCVRGVASLAVAGGAGPHPLTGPGSGPGHRRLALTWDAAQVRAGARAHGVSTTVLTLAVLAEALAEPGGPSAVRAMVPLTTRLRRGGAVDAPGNRTAAVSVSLPTGPMPPRARVAAVARALDRAVTGGQPEGASAVLPLLGLLPRPLQRRLTRVVYGRRFFHLLASVMPGPRRPLHARGGLIRTVAPVLPLADGVGLAVGVLGWGPTLGVGITVDEAIVPAAHALPNRLEVALSCVAAGESAGSG